MSQDSTIGVERLTKCVICTMELRDAMRLPCSHVFCKSCLLGSNKAGKLECPSCRTVHIVQSGDLDKEQEEIEGICQVCLPPPNPKAKPKIGPDGKPLPEPEPLKVKLSFCFHCGKRVCQSCQNKHYTAQRQEALKLADDYQVSTGNVAVVCEKINEARAKKLIEYDKMKIDVANRKQEILKNLDLEEKEILAKIDFEIKQERKRIQNTENDSKRLASCREGVKTVRQKLVSLEEDPSETNVKKLSTLCRDLLMTKEEWNNLLSGEAARNDPNKEKRIFFLPNKNKEVLLGEIDTKKENLKLKPAQVPKTEKSSVCTIV